MCYHCPDENNDGHFKMLRSLDRISLNYQVIRRNTRKNH